jgi:hypothetical protein
MIFHSLCDFGPLMLRENVYIKLDKSSRQYLWNAHWMILRMYPIHILLSSVSYLTVMQPITAFFYLWEMHCKPHKVCQKIFPYDMLLTFLVRCHSWLFQMVITTRRKWQIRVLFYKMHTTAAYLSSILEAPSQPNEIQFCKRY